MASAETVAKIGTAEYETLAAAVTAAKAGETVEITVAGTYTVPNISTNITIKGDVDDVVFNCVGAEKTSIASIPNGATFKNVTLNMGNVNYHGFQHAGTINMEGCTLNGKFFSYGNMNFTNCQFVHSGDYHMWIYGAGTVSFNNCTFTNNGKFLHLYNESAQDVTVNVTGCTFVNTGNTANKAAINVKATCADNGNILEYSVNVENSTVQGAFPEPGVRANADNTDVISPLVQVDDRKVAASSEKITVNVDNEPVYQAGAETEVVEISNVAEFKAFRDAVNSGNQYSGKIVRLMVDLDLSSEANWKPIGNLVSYPTQSFDGICFDGNNHTISNVTVNDNTPENAVAALFGSVVNATIKNLTVKDVNITSTHFAAGIVAYTSNTPSIINCHVVGGTITSTPELKGSSYDNGDKAGGIMGYCTTGTTIKDCTVEGVTITAYRDLAGICGYADGTVTDCTVKDVTVVQDNTNAYKTEDVAYTACEVVGGRSANAATTNAANTTENVTVNTGVTANYVAQIGTTKYETLEAAFAAATDGATITLLADCAGNGIKVAPQGKYTTGLTVDFGGFTYTVDGETVGSTGTETNGFQLLKDNKITFKNGTITSTKAKILVQNYSNLTLKGMTLTLNNPNYASAYTLSNNNGNVAIDGTTINANPAGGFAFDVCRYSSYPSVSVEVKGNSTINGNVEISASGSDPKDGFGLTLTSGTLNGNIVVDASAAAAMEATPEKATVTKDDDFTQAAPAGFEWVSNNDGTSTLTELPSVAKIGDVEYKSLAEAVAAVPTDGAETTITMIADEAIVGNGVTIAAGQNVVLDLNGKTISQTGPMTETSWLIKNQGTLTIKDNTDTNKDGTGTGKMTSTAENPDTGEMPSYATNLISNYGVLNIESGYFQVLTNEGYASYVVDNYSGGTANISGGKLTNTAEYEYVVRMFLNSTTANNALNISGTAVITGSYAVWMQYANANANKAELNISGGTLEATDGYALFAGAASSGTRRDATNISVNISGGNIGGTGAWIGSDTQFESISVSGGTFANLGASAVGGSGFITGGTYTSTSLFTQTRDENSPILAEGYTVVGEGPYTVEQTSVAKIGTTYYATLEAAVAAAQDGDKVTLLADCAGNGIKVPQGKYTTGLTVDFGGFTYTVDGETVGSTGTETNGFQLLKDNKITFKNGTITSEKAKILVQNYSDLTLEGMTLTLNNTSYNGAYTLSNNNGDVVIDGSTINANPTTGSFAFDVCRYSTYPSVNVTVTGGSTINGNVEIYASGSDAKDGFSLNLNGGTMTGDIVVDATAATIIETTPDKAVVTKADAFDKTAPEGFKWESNGDGTSTLVEDIYVLTDGIAYTNDEDITNAKVAYKRTFGADRANVFQAWMVPFDYTLTATDVANFDFYEINTIEYAEQDNTTKMKIRLSSAKAAGDELEANMPYIYMPKSAVGEYTFKAEGVTLTAADGATVRKNFGVASGVIVDFYSVYQNTKPTDENFIYYMSKAGKVGYSRLSTTGFAGVGPFRWIFKVSGTNAPSTAFTFGFAADEDDDVTAVSSAAAEAEGEVVGYYTLNGQKVSEPTKGVYVVKYANGTSKKVVF